MDFDPISYINEPRWRSMSLGLDRMRLLLELLGNPERLLRFAHVAGTNGKGSTCAYHDAIIRASGLRAGLFTSPYLETFEERIRVDGKNISADALCACTLDVKRAAEIVEERTGEHPTEFELMGAVALMHFAREECDLCIMEVGLGGRLDATNVITPELSVITPVSLDHTQILGDTIEAVAAEKAGIIKPGVPCVSGIQPPAALGVITRACEERGSALSVLDASSITESALTADLQRTFTFEGERFQTGLLGAYQPENAALAIMAARALASLGWPLSEKSIREGIRRAQWPGRFEMAGTRPLTLVDGAHNPAGSRALRASLDELACALGKPIRPLLVVGVLADKDVERIMEPQVERGRAFFLYPPDNPRALPADDLAKIILRLDGNAEVHPFQNAGAAMTAALEKAAPEDVVVAFGSLYSIGALKRARESWQEDHSSSGESRP